MQAMRREPNANRKGAQVENLCYGGTATGMGSPEPDTRASITCEPYERQSTSFRTA